MKSMEIKLYGKTYKVKPKIDKYTTYKNLCISLVEENGSPFSCLTVNLIQLPENYAFVDTNNMPSAEEFIKKYELGKSVDQWYTSGFCSYPLYVFDIEKIKEFMK